MKACRLCTPAPIASKFGEAIQYGPRHYAHAECGLKMWGSAFFDRLSLAQLLDFPYFAAKAAGLADDLTQRIRKTEEA